MIQSFLMELGRNWRCEESAKSARSFLRRHFATCWQQRRSAGGLGYCSL